MARSTRKPTRAQRWGASRMLREPKACAICGRIFTKQSGYQYRTRAKRHARTEPVYCRGDHDPGFIKQRSIDDLLRGIPVSGVLSLTLRDTIVALVAGGAFDHVAAEAVGIAPPTLAAWLRRGAKDRQLGVDSAHRDLYDRVTIARGKARAIAEGRVWRDKPEIWLQKGPGRSRDGLPGWSEREEDVRRSALLAAIEELPARSRQIVLGELLAHAPNPDRIEAPEDGYAVLSEPEDDPVD